MEAGHCFYCPAGCDFCVSGGAKDVLPLLWDHLVMVHREGEVSASDVLGLALAKYPVLRR